MVYVENWLVNPNHITAAWPNTNKNDSGIFVKFIDGSEMPFRNTTMKQFEELLQWRMTINQK